MNAVRWRVTKYEGTLLAIVLLGLALRVYHLSAQSVWYDEAYSVWISQLGLPQIVQTTAKDVHPPLYYVILHYWMAIFGTSEGAVRLLSVLFGVLSIPMIYVVGRQLFNEKVGLVAALFLSLSSFNIWYSQETRMYTLMVLLALLSMYFFLRFLQRDNLAISVGYIVSTTLLLYTHFYGAFAVVAQNIYVLSLLLLSRNRTFRLRRWVIVQATVLVLFVPWISALTNQAAQQATIVSQQHSVSGALYFIFYNLGRTFISYSGQVMRVSQKALISYPGTIALSVLFLGLSILSLFTLQKARDSPGWKAPLKALQSYSWKIRRQDAASVYFLAVWLLTIALIPLIVSQFYAVIYAERYTIAASAALYLLVAKGITNIVRRPVQLAVIAVIVVLCVANLQGYYTSTTRPRAREAIGLIDANAESGDVVLIVPSAEKITFDYYNNRTDVIVPSINFPMIVSQIDHPEDKANEIRSSVNGHDRVWLFAETHFSNVANFTATILDKSYALSYKGHYEAFPPMTHVYDIYLFKKAT